VQLEVDSNQPCARQAGVEPGRGQRVLNDTERGHGAGREGRAFHTGRALRPRRVPDADLGPSRDRQCRLEQGHGTLLSPPPRSRDRGSCRHRRRASCR
jgi:hypothetical protein